MGFEKFGWVSYVRDTRLAEFVDYLQEGIICGTKCSECGSIQFPPRAHCPRCLSSNFEWKELSGECVLITHTNLQAAPSMFEDRAPYLLGLAELSEGPKVFAWIEKTIPEAQVTIGMKLRLKATTLSNGHLAYVLNPAESKEN